MSPKTGIETVTLRNGYWFYFYDGDLRITAFGSGLSGREAVFVEEELVSSKRSFRMGNIHHFDYANHRYQVELKVESIWTGQLSCTLSKDGEVIARETKSYIENPNDFWKANAKGILLIGLLGGVVGFLVGFFTSHH